MTGRPLRCGSSDAAHCIELHWRGRDQANLVRLEPGKWAGPCPECGRFRSLSVSVGDKGIVVWNIPGCEGRHTREDVYPALLARVPCAASPGHRHNPELDRLKEVIRGLAVNEKFIHSNPIKLAILEAIGDTANDALDALGITDTGHRRRTRVARDKALSPAPTATNGSKPRSKPPRAQNARRLTNSGRLPAETRLPAATATNGSPEAATNGSPPSTGKPPLTSTFPDLTDRGTLVSAPGGSVRNTNTHLGVALELLRTELGAEVISTEPRTSPGPVTDTIEAWTQAEQGPCARCGLPCCRYGDRGSPLCADCRDPAEVRTAG